MPEHKQGPTGDGRALLMAEAAAKAGSDHPQAMDSTEKRILKGVSIWILQFTQ